MVRPGEEVREAVKEELSVYVALLDEGVDVWRPVAARHVHGDEYTASRTVRVASSQRTGHDPVADVALALCGG